MSISSGGRQTAWIFSAGAVVAAGLLGGWMFGQGQRSTQDAPPVDVPNRDQPQAAPRENRLAKETSPYLQLHKHNPVDWYPWGGEPFEKARKEDKVVFLSIGYSSCYWCHVMERESFSNAEIAKVLNEHFVCIKVDREELPDVDEVYMNAVQDLTGRGGWPLSVFLTPERKPFLGGTYFPATKRNGMPGFTDVLHRVLELWRDQRADCEAQAERIVRSLQRSAAWRSFSIKKLDRAVVEQAVADLAKEFDREQGGFGFHPEQPRRPKFPQPSNLQLLLYALRQDDDARALGMLTLTLDRLARGGLWDHLGGGFHRYSTDRFWRVPHFEKMLYDNAQLASVYLEAFELTDNSDYRRQAEQIFAFVAREMTAPQGGFYSALDAESEGEEGKYYVWSEQEIKDVLTAEEFEIFAAVYGLRGPANFEGRYVLQRFVAPGDLAAAIKVAPEELEGLLDPMRRKLLTARAKRPRPLLDTKILTDWNGLMIAALADGHRILKRDECRKSAERAAGMLLTRSRGADGRLVHSYTDGTAKVPAYLEDHAFLLQGLLALHRATQEGRWLAEARGLADQMIELFWDESGGGFFNVASDQEPVLARLKPSRDSVWPSGNSAAVRGLVALAQATGERRYAELAGRTLAAFAGELGTSPAGQPHMVRGLAEYLDAGFGPRRDEQKVVRGRAFLSLDRLQPGREFELAVIVEIERDWHIYANPPSPPEVGATTLEVSSEFPLEGVTVQYPKPVTLSIEGAQRPVAAYVGRALLRAAAKLGEDAVPGKGEIKVKLRYQPCDNQRCLAPQTLEIVLPVEVVAAGETVHEILPEIFRSDSVPKR